MNDAERGQETRLPDRSSSGVVWIGLLAALAVFIAVGRVRTYRGGGLRGSARIWDIWRLLRHELPLPSLLVIVVALIMLVGSAWALWLALVMTSHQTIRPRLRPPTWAIGALIPVAIVFVTLVLWADPRDDVTAEALLNQTGVERTLIPTVCATFFNEAAAVRSGDLQAGRAERATGHACRAAMATIWPTQSQTWPTQVALWSTVEAAAR